MLRLDDGQPVFRRDPHRRFVGFNGIEEPLIHPGDAIEESSRYPFDPVHNRAPPMAEREVPGIREDVFCQMLRVVRNRGQAIPEKVVDQQLPLAIRDQRPLAYRTIEIDVERGRNAPGL